MKNALKIAGFIILLTLFLDIFGSLAGFIFPFFLLFLILFPGKDRKTPRFIKVFPWLLGLEFISSILFFFVDVNTLGVPDSSLLKPKPAELWAVVLSSPILLWLFLRRHQASPYILLLSGIVGTAITVSGYLNGTRETAALMELVADQGSEWMIVIYLMRWARAGGSSRS